jgi:two-component system LytT family sensor kinase
MNNVTLTGDQFILFALVLKLGVVASLATVLVSSARFKKMLFAEDAGAARDMRVAVLLAFLFSFGVTARILIGYGAVDVSLPGVFLIGLMCGPGFGSLAGGIVAAPAVLHGEYLALPLFVLTGLAGGVIRRTLGDRAVIWSFSPLPFVNMYRYAKSALFARKIEGQLVIFLSCLTLDLVHYAVASKYDSLLYDLHPEHAGVLICMVFATLSCVGIPLKIWNNTRLEERLEQRELRLIEARYQALKNQINPHFLFNTLNSIASCLQSEPRKARWILVKLSEILRRLLYSEGDLVPLSKELDFIDSYLQIEAIRFGEEKLRVTKSIDPRVLDVAIPGMVIQPFVENAIKHGIAPLIEGGQIDISAIKRNGTTVVTIMDNGPGITETFSAKGIGIKNVVERLRMVYGPGEWCTLAALPGGGTRVELRFPDRRPGLMEDRR